MYEHSISIVLIRRLPHNMGTDLGLSNFRGRQNIHHDRHLSNRLGNWRDEKNPARNDRRGDLVLMKGTGAKNLVQTFP